MSDGVVYDRLDVALHGLDADSAQQVAGEVEALLLEHFDPDLTSDVWVELIESAGVERVQ